MRNLLRRGKLSLGGGAALAVLLAGMFASAQELEDGDRSEVPSTPDAGADESTDVPPEEIGDAGTPLPEPEPVVCDTPEKLYTDACQKRVTEYVPAFELWSDDAGKERFIYLPDGAKIDASDPDYWRFPPGTVLFKTFKRDGKKMETRVIKKTKDGVGYDAWDLRAFAWNADETVATDTTGKSDDDRTLSTGHYVPSQVECAQCHGLNGSVDPILGFSAVQLNPANRAGLPFTLAQLSAKLDNANAKLEQASIVPGDATAKKALGYLHANCAHCHGNVSYPTRLMDLRTLAGAALAAPLTVADTPAFKATLCKPMTSWVFNGEERLKPVADPSSDTGAYGGLLKRMAIRRVADPFPIHETKALAPPFSPEQMPPLATGMQDEDGMKLITEWVDALGREYACEGGAPVRLQ